MRTSNRDLPGFGAGIAAMPTSRHATRMFASIVFGAIVAAALTACGGVGGYNKPLGVMDAWGNESARVAICRTPADFGQAEEFVDAPWYDCFNGSLRRFASSQGSLMCSTRLTVPRRKRVLIQVFRGRTLIAHGNFRSAVSDAVAFAAIHRADVTSTPGRGLPPGSYRCRFRVGRRVVRDRRFTVMRSLRRPPIRPTR
jgi:hypothetical protein